MRKASPVLWFLAVALGTTMIGCGGASTYPVQGRVVFADGSPLKGGMVEFRSTNAEGKFTNARGTIQDDGSFQLTTVKPNDGALAGTHEVVVVPLVSTISIEGQMPPPPPIDHKYGDFATSGLKFTVEPGKKNECVLTVSPPMMP